MVAKKRLPKHSYPYVKKLFKTQHGRTPINLAILAAIGHRFIAKTKRKCRLSWGERPQTGDYFYLFFLGGRGALQITTKLLGKILSNELTAVGIDGIATDETLMQVKQHSGLVEIAEWRQIILTNQNVRVSQGREVLFALQGNAFYLHYLKNKFFREKEIRGKHAQCRCFYASFVLSG